MKDKKKKIKKDKKKNNTIDKKDEYIESCNDCIHFLFKNEKLIAFGDVVLFDYKKDDKLTDISFTTEYLDSETQKFIVTKMNTIEKIYLNLIELNEKHSNSYSFSYSYIYNELILVVIDNKNGILKEINQGEKI